VGDRGVFLAMSEMPTETQALITVRRDSPEDVQLRQIIVELDGEKAGELLYGQTVTIPAAPGRHKLRVDNTWNWKTIELDLKAGDHVRFLTMSKAGRLTAFLAFTLGGGPMYVSIQKDE